MSFDDFMQEFNEIQMCHQTIDCFLIGYESLSEKFDSTWKTKTYNSKWKECLSADDYPEKISQNPQFLIQVVDQDGFNLENKVNLIVELMQKCARYKEEYIDFQIFKVLNWKIFPIFLF